MIGHLLPGQLNLVGQQRNGECPPTWILTCITDVTLQGRTQSTESRDRCGRFSSPRLEQYCSRRQRFVRICFFFLRCSVLCSCCLTKYPLFLAGAGQAHVVDQLGTLRSLSHLIDFVLSWSIVRFASDWRFCSHLDYSYWYTYWDCHTFCYDRSRVKVLIEQDFCCARSS